VALSPAVAGYDALLLDLDGCVYVGDKAVPGSVEAVEAWREAGKGLAFLTNDARHSAEEYVRKLWRLGFRASVHEVVTVGAATQRLLAERGGGTAFVIGTEPFIEHVALAGMRVVNNTELAPRADVVVVAGHDDLHYAELRAATQAVLRGAELVGATRDRTFPMPDGPWPASGAVLAAVEAATARTADLVVGKPEPPMYDTALEGLSGRVLAVGDRIDIDVAGARRAGLDAALVLSGTTSQAEADAADPAIGLVAATLGTLVLGG